MLAQVHAASGASCAVHEYQLTQVLPTFKLNRHSTDADNGKASQLICISSSCLNFQTPQIKDVGIDLVWAAQLNLVCMLAS